MKKWRGAAVLTIQRTTAAPRRTLRGKHRNPATKRSGVSRPIPVESAIPHPIGFLLSPTSSADLLFLFAACCIPRGLLGLISHDNLVGFEHGRELLP